MEQLVGAVGLPAFLGERHKHLSTIGLATRTLHKTLGHKLANGCRESCERHVEARGDHIHGARAVQADGVNGVDFGNREAAG